MDFKNEETTSHTCVDCGNEYELTEGEKAFYIERALVIPKRCKSCRHKRKMEKR